MNMLTILALLACVEPSSSPYVGDCAVYPDGVYDYGQMGIGSCLAGPVSLDWLPHPNEDGRYYLAVANANPFLDFTGGSVVAIDVDAVALDGGTSLSHEVVVSALDMPSFPGYAAWVEDRSLLLVTNRLSEDARTRVGFDDLYFVDVSDPAALSFAAVAEGEDGGLSDHLELMSDPDPIAYDPESGYAFVANLTSHTISVVDVQADPVSVLDAVGSAYVSEGWFLDADLSGSRAELVELEVIDFTSVLDDQWSATYAEGTWRLWLPTAAGVYRITSYGDEDWQESELGYELDPTDAADEDITLGQIEEPQPWLSGLGTRMVFLDAATGDVSWAEADAWLGSWSYSGESLLSGREGEWDAALGGPHVTSADGIQHLFYDGVDADGVGGIGLATSTDGSDFSRLSDEPVVSAGAGAHDAVRAADPFVLYDNQVRLWRMYYSAYDGTDWTIGHATSPDLETWTADTEPIFSVDGGWAVAPVVDYTGSEFRMWTTRQDGDGWAIGLATSWDGDRWTDHGIVAPIDGAPSSGEIPGAGLQSQVSAAWTLFGEQAGTLSTSFQAGDAVIFGDYGFGIQLSAGAWLGVRDAPDEAINGVQPGAWLPEQGLVYATVFDDTGTPSIALVDWPEDGDPSIREVVVSGEEGAFDASGASAPAVIADPSGDGYLMLYAGASEGSVAIGLATSDDGVTWTTDHEAVFSPGDDWDSIGVEPGALVYDDAGQLQLWYTGSNGTRTRIGLATSSDGRSWTRTEGPDDDWTFGPGSPGEFDDASVGDPFVLRDGETEHLWYSASDGDAARIGYASRPLDSGEAFTRALDPVTEEPRPVLDLSTGLFDTLSTLRPLVAHSDDEGYRMIYSGLDGAIYRAGVAVGLSPDALYRSPRIPTVGDYFSFNTFLGDDDDEEAISLEQTVDGVSLSGIGVSQILHDPARGFLYVASKLASYIYVLDVRDDSSGYFDDANYLGVEAVLAADTTSGATGFRGMLAPEDSDWLFAVNDAPESVMMMDMSEIVDDAYADLHPDAVEGYLAAPKGSERDEGGDTTASVGPASMAQRGDLLFVANFNANSVGVYDLRLGNYGSLVDEVLHVGENPHALALSPDGSLLAVANYTGDLAAGRAESSIALIDVDPESPTYLEVLAWIANL